MKLLLFLALSFPLFAANPDSLKTILDFSLQNSPEYLQTKFSYEIRRISNDLKWYSYKPQFSISGDDSENRTYSTSLTIDDGISLGFSRSDKLGKDNKPQDSFTLRSDIFSSFASFDKKLIRMERDEIELGLIKATEDFKIRVINAVYDLVSKKKSLEVQQESLSHWINTYNYYKAKFELGSINKISLLNAEVNYLEQENSVNQSEKSLEDSIDSFKILIGFPFSDTLEINSNLPEESFDWLTIPQYQSYEERLADLALEKARIQKLKSRRDLPGDLNFSQTINSGSSDTYSGSLSYSFYLGTQKNSKEFQSLSISLEQEILSRQRQKLLSESERREIIRRYDLLKKNLDISKKKLESARESNEYAQVAIQKGLISSLDLQNAQEKLTSAQLDLLSSTISFIRLRYEMTVTFGGQI